MTADYGSSMFFRNLTLFRFPTSLDLTEIENRLAECALKPVGALELSSRGFISPFGRDGESLSHKISDAIWLSVGSEEKILPGAVVNDLLARKLEEIERKEGRKPGGRARERLPEGLTIGDECELKDAADKGAVVKCQRQELQSDEIAKHLESGKQVTRLALTLDDHVSFVLGEDLVVRKFKLLEGAVDALESTERDDVRAELDARFALMAAEAKRLFNVLEPALKISRVED